jgi:hypothetical protein
MEILALIVMFVFFSLLGLGVIKIIEYFEEESRRKHLNLTEKQYKQYKNVEKRCIQERYGMGDDEEYLKVIKELKLSGWEEDDIEDFIKDAKELNLTEVGITEYLRDLILEDDEDPEGKWVDLLRNDKVK